MAHADQRRRHVGSVHVYLNTVDAPHRSLPSLGLLGRRSGGKQHCCRTAGALAHDRSSSVEHFDTDDSQRFNIIFNITTDGIVDAPREE